ncbi:hypothetical protein [Pedobacter sp. P26]
MDIKATIYLKNHIKVSENGTPDFDALKKYAIKALSEIVVPEIYPEVDLK